MIMAKESRILLISFLLGTAKAGITGGEGLKSWACSLRGGGSEHTNSHFFGNFEDEVRQEREQFELETVEAFKQLENELFQQQKETQQRSQQGQRIRGEKVQERERRSSGQFVEGAYYTDEFQNDSNEGWDLGTYENEELDSVASLQQITDALHVARDQAKRRKPIKVSVAAVSGGVKSMAKKPSKKAGAKKKSLNGRERDFLEARKHLQVELESAQKAIARSELRRAAVTGVLLVLLCMFTALALRVVERSLGVP
jgi:hypothetical protein